MNLKGIEKPESVARAVLAAYGEKGMGAGRIMSNGVIEKHGRSD